MVTLNGCASLKKAAALAQHAVGGIYDPTKQIVNDQLTVILDAVVCQDAAMLKTQFAPNAIAAQPELDSQIEELFHYYGGKMGEICSISAHAGSSSDGTGEKKRDYAMSGKITSGETHLVYIRATTKDTNDPDNIGVWTLILRRKADETDYPDELSYHVIGEDDMVGIYVGLPAYRFDLELPAA